VYFHVQTLRLELFGVEKIKCECTRQSTGEFEGQGDAKQEVKGVRYLLGIAPVYSSVLKYMRCSYSTLGTQKQSPKME
jgi:hypothetical protein